MEHAEHCKRLRLASYPAEAVEASEKQELRPRTENIPAAEAAVSVLRAAAAAKAERLLFWNLSW
jgi:hypothetical protein